MRWALDALDAPSRGELTLAASHTPSVVLIPPLLREFSERYPGVTVRVRTMPSEFVVREVARGAADIGTHWCDLAMPRARLPAGEMER